MKVAARLAGRIARLVLLETNPFYLLAQAGRMDAFAEAVELRNYIKKFGALGEWATAAERFADYWNGAGTWREMSFDRRIAFSEALKPNFFEWDAVMNETTSAAQWATLVASFLGLASKQSESDQGWQWASPKHAQASLADLINGPD
jgi:hypothetical protein